LQAGGGAAFWAGLGLPGSAQAMPPHRVPAEEAPHQATFLQWPVTRQVYADRWFRRDVQATILDLANTIAAFEPVILLAGPEHHGALARRIGAGVTLWDIPTDDLWARDSGPLFTRLAGGGLAINHIRFNGWGRYDLPADAAVAARVAERLGLPLIEAGITGEPGGVESDGHGLLMAHESSWLTRSRNPCLTRDEVEARLLAAYGAERMIWAPGLAGLDVTDYHIDSLARFTGPGRVLMTLPDTPDRNDPFHRAAAQTFDILAEAALEIEVIPEPVERRVRDLDFVASYANYYVCNGAVISAQFGDPDTDSIAADALAAHYPGREIIQLNVDVLGELGGGIHCATQQMPVG
jgi:agmatine deiminase